MATKLAEINRAVTLFVTRPYTKRSELTGRVLFTNASSQASTINDAAVFYATGAEFTIPASYITTNNLNATAQLQVSVSGGAYETVKTVTITKPVSATPAGGGLEITDVTPAVIGAAPVGHTHVSAEIVDLDAAADGLNGVTSLPPFVTSTIATGTGTLRWYNDSGRSLSIVAVRVSTSAAPTGSATLIDVNVNGTTIFSTQGNRPSLTASNVTAVSTTVNSPIVASGQYVTVDIDQIGTFAGGTTLSVFITAV